MENTDLQQFKAILEPILDALELPLRRRDEIAVDNSPDTLDQVQHAANRDLAIHQLESDSSRLRDVRQAIQRIDEGTYGVCLRCDMDISLKRLKAVPWAAYCLSCQDIVEREQTETAKDEAVPKVHMAAGSLFSRS